MLKILKLYAIHSSVRTKNTSLQSFYLSSSIFVTHKFLTLGWLKVIKRLNAMGRTRNKISRATKNKTYKKRHDTKRRRRDIDQIQDDVKRVEAAGKPIAFEHDDELPGLGQYYCLACARHFADQSTLDTHLVTKLHRRRLKDLAQEQYTIEEAERGAGKTKEILPPAHPDRLHV